MRTGRAIYNHGGEILVLIVEDSTGKKLDKWKLNMDDRNSINKIFKILEDKYGFVNVKKLTEEKGFLDI